MENKHSQSSIAEHMNSLPNDWWKAPALHRSWSDWFSKHSCFLHVAFRQNKETKHEVYSGFLVFHNDELFWITAGHVVKEIEMMHEDASVEVCAMSFIDDHPEGAGCISIHFDRIIYDYLDTDQYDIGAMLLRPFYREPLLANANSLPLESLVWSGLKNANPEGYLVVGSPRSWVKIRESEIKSNSCNVRVSVPAVCASVEKIEDIGKQHESDSFWGYGDDAFYGTVLDIYDESGNDLEDIRGMSGGPVYSIERIDGKIKYYLFAVQSCWLDKSRTIRATPIWIIQPLMDELTKRLYSDDKPGAM
ncbi:MAG: hypothetical protein RLN78_02730 [Phycisphaerales bacterium]